MRQRASGDDRAMWRRTPSGWALALLLAWCAVIAAGCGSTVAPQTQATAPAVSYDGRSTPTLTAPQSATPVPTPPGPVWIPLRSQSAADILAAVKQAPFLSVVSSAPPSSDGYTDVSRLGAPVLVIAYHAPGNISTSAPDYYEVPVLTSSGTVTATINAQLNPAHSALYVGSVSGSEASDHWPSTLVSADRAAQLVLTTFHTELRSGSHVQLVYLSAYNTTAIETGQLNWQAGGGGPQNPIWLVPAANGHDYFVGTDGRAYTLAQLPLTR